MPAKIRACGRWYGHTTPPPVTCSTRWTPTTPASARRSTRSRPPQPPTAPTPPPPPGRVWPTAIELLRSVLDPHLRREEDEMMPIVSRSITHAQWEAFNNTNFVKPKSKKELGHEGHWLIDNLDPERYDVVVHHVPALPRFILIHAMARPYRQECADPMGTAGPGAAAEPTTSHEWR